MHPLFHLNAWRSLPFALRVGGAVTLICAAFGVRYVVLGVSAYSPFTLFYPVILISALMFGRNVGLVATLLAALLALIFIEPVGFMVMPDFEELIGVSLFAGVGAFACLVVDWLYDLCRKMAIARATAEKARSMAEAALQAEAWAQDREKMED